MNSLYNMVQGTNLLAPLLIQMLGIDGNKIPRFRDCWLEDNGAFIILLTRTGGGNREAYVEENEALRKHELYVSDVDDSFDETFARFRYMVPQKYVDDCHQIAVTFVATQKGEETNGPEASVTNLGYKLNPETRPPHHGLTKDDPVIKAGSEALERLVDAISKEEEG